MDDTDPTAIFAMTIAERDVGLQAVHVVFDRALHQALGRRADDGGGRAEIQLDVPGLRAIFGLGHVDDFGLRLADFAGAAGQGHCRNQGGDRYRQSECVHAAPRLG